MLKGGLYLYPSTAAYPNGKLRLLYECNPMAFIIEQAGGKASDGAQRIMDIKPTELHQRVPFLVGSTHMVDNVEEFLKNFPDEECSKRKPGFNTGLFVLELLDTELVKQVDRIVCTGNRLDIKI